MATAAASAAWTAPREGQRVSRTARKAIGASMAAESNRAWISLKLASLYRQDTTRRVPNMRPLHNRFALPALMLALLASTAARADVAPLPGLGRSGAVSPVLWITLIVIVSAGVILFVTVLTAVVGREAAPPHLATAAGGCSSCSCRWSTT